MSSGVLLYQLRQSRKAISRDTDLFISCICLCSGGILVFQGWRLDPLLLLCQLFTTTVALSYALEAIKARQSNAPSQEEQPTQKTDPRARSQQVYEYRDRSFELPPPATQDAYSEWARDNEAVRWQEEPFWQEAGSRGEYRQPQQESRRGSQSYGRSQPAETSSGQGPQNGSKYYRDDDDRYEYDGNGYPMAQRRQSNGYSQADQRQRDADRQSERPAQQDNGGRRDNQQDRDVYRDRSSGSGTDWEGALASALEHCIGHKGRLIVSPLATMQVLVSMQGQTAHTCRSESRLAVLGQHINRRQTRCQRLFSAQASRTHKRSCIVASQNGLHTALQRANHTLRDASNALQSCQLSLKGTAAAVLLSGVLIAGPTQAADFAKVGTCLLTSCQVALARCLGDGECLENLACLNLCNNKKDETACQIRCGDLYSDAAISTFNACAVSDKKCVPQRVDSGPGAQVPTEDKLSKSFDLDNFQGRWYITAGLNPLFDQFDCQEHYFGVPEPGKLVAKINWRIPRGKQDFIERSVVQRFVQQENPALLLNHGNSYLHYEDDWFIIKSRPDVYNFIFYRGNNDAWKGYTGGTVYTRAATLPEEYIPELKEAAESIGLNWADFKITDNSCKPHPPATSKPTKFRELEEDEARALEYTIEEDLKSFGKGFTVIEQGLLAELQKDEKGIEKELRDAESFLEGIEKQYHLPDFLNFLPTQVKNFFMAGKTG
ncbi:hypothetical protein WJX73_009081 [Symbiochloris irregularis]|uniref:VDE lipocalin domain-containing protein n=1 Tax=Symbiochloris irregularis TaxID=706552 RepID=A0AAW1PLV7_9CHLO